MVLRLFVATALSLALTLAGWSGGGWGSSPAAAQTAPGSPTSLDLLFLVDQSGSMGGEAYGTPASVVPVPNDPAGLRFAAPAAAINILGLDRLGLRRSADYRVGVISFGDHVDDTLPLTHLTPASDTEWNALQKVVLPPISAEQWAGRNLGTTDFVQPFRRACEVLGAAGAPAGRQRVIVLITDGLPEGPGITSVTAHLAQVRDVVQSCLNGPGFRLYVVAMKDLTNPRYWDPVQGTWEGISQDPARVGIVNSNEQVHQRVGAILRELVPWGDRVAQQTYVPPYLDSVTFRFFKTSADDRILLYPDGTGAPINAACAPPVVCQGASGVTEIVTVPFPKPGIWRVEIARGRDVEVWKTELPATVVVKSPPSLTEFASSSIDVSLLTTKGALVPDPADAGQRLDWSGTQVLIGGQAVPLQLTPKDGAFSASFRPEQPGPARLQLRGRVNGYDATGRPAPVTLVEREEPLPDVVAGTMVRPQLAVAPLDAGGHSSVHALPFWVGDLDAQPVQFTLRLNTTDGKPVGVADLCGADDALALAVQGPQGEQEVPLVPQQPGGAVLTGVAALPRLGAYTVALRPRVAPKPGFALEDLAPVGFERAEPPNRQVGELVEKALAALLALGAAGWLFVLVRDRLPPRLIGAVEVNAGGRPVTVPLDRRRNRQRIAGSRLPKEAKLRCIRVRQRPTPKQRYAGARPVREVEIVVQPTKGSSRSQRLRESQSLALPGGGSVRYHV